MQEMRKCVVERSANTKPICKDGKEVEWSWGPGD